MGCGSSSAADGGGGVSSPSASSRNAHKYSTFTIDGPSRSFLQRHQEASEDKVKIATTTKITTVGAVITKPDDNTNTTHHLGQKSKSNVSGTSSAGTHLSVPYATQGYNNTSANRSPLMFRSFQFPTEDEFGHHLSSGKTSRAASVVSSAGRDPTPPPAGEQNTGSNEISLIGPGSLRLLCGRGGASPLIASKESTSVGLQSPSVPPGAVVSATSSSNDLQRLNDHQEPRLSRNGSTNSKYLYKQDLPRSMGQATMIMMLGTPSETGRADPTSKTGPEDTAPRRSCGKIVPEPEPEEERREKEAQVRMAKIRVEKHEYCEFTEEVERKQALRIAADAEDSDLEATERRKLAEVEEWAQSLRENESLEISHHHET